MWPARLYWIFYTKGCFVLSLVNIAPMVQEKNKFENFTLTNRRTTGDKKLSVKMILLPVSVDLTFSFDQTIVILFTVKLLIDFHY